MKRAIRLIAASPVALALALTTHQAHAAGVAAGTLIENTATASYTTGSSTVTVDSNTVTLLVDELLDVAVSPLVATPVPAASGTIVLTYSLTNTGNGPEAFTLTANPAVSGNDFDVTITGIVIDSNGNNTYDPGVDTVVAPGAATPAIAADGSLTVFVLAELPAGANDAETSQVQLTAEAVTGTGAPGTAFAGQGEGGGDAVVGASGADDDGLTALVATLVTITLTKTAAIADPYGGAQSVPGAVITYTLVAQAAGTGSASGLHITDVIPAGTTYQAGTLTLEGAGLTDAADSDAGVASASGIDVAVPALAGGESRSVTFQVKIN